MRSKPALTHGTSDELGFYVAENPVHVHDFQATVMHLLGFDHEKCVKYIIALFFVQTSSTPERPSPNASTARPWFHLSMTKDEF